MAIKILMPALSPTMECGTVSGWQKKEGDKVVPGDILAEIETDKATMEVEAVDEGVLGKIIVPAGTEDVRINTVIAVLLEEGETADAIDALDLSISTGSKKIESTIHEAVVGGVVALDVDTDKKHASVKTQKPLVESVVLMKASPSAAPLPVPVAPAPASPPPAISSSGRVFASPLARRLAKEYGLDLNQIQGTAAHGRIIKADVENAKASGGGRVPSSTANYQIRDLSPMPEYQSIAPDNIRKVIARRLTQSKQEVPHFYLNIKVNLNNLLALRAQYNQPFGDNKSQKISINDLIIKAVALSLRDVPEANASWLGDEIRQYNRSDISIAVASPKGLITPIVRDADNKPIGVISAEVKTLVGKAREGALQPVDYEGGTFSISNLGMYGIEDFQAIINPPQGCILAVGQAVKTPIYDEDDNLIPAMLLGLSLSADHRVVDGAVGADFMTALRKNLENPLWLFL